MVIQKSESVMNGFFQAFRMEVLRAIQNSFFPTTYFAILITLFLNIYLYTTTDSYVSVAYLLEYSHSYHITFETQDGEQIELRVKRYEYQELEIGDRGMLTHQGTRYKGFER